jgi:single-strand DNA-binding protein
MARSYNKVIIMGNLTRDPELRNIPSGQSVCSFSLALNRSYKAADGSWAEAVDYINVVAWGPLGERVAQYMTKGKPVLVEGRLQTSSWEKDGIKQYKTEVNANDVTFIGSAGGSDDSSQVGSDQSSQSSTQKDVVVEDIGDEPINLDDIPF